MEAIFIVLDESFPGHKGRPGMVGGSSRVYHGTTIGNLRGIARKGIIPRYSNYGFGKENKVWVSTSFNKAAQWGKDNATWLPEGKSFAVVKAIIPSGIALTPDKRKDQWGPVEGSFTLKNVKKEWIQSATVFIRGRKFKEFSMSELKRKALKEDINENGDTVVYIPVSLNSELLTDFEVPMDLNESFPDHAGRPGKEGGSLPRGRSEAFTLPEGEIDIKSSGSLLSGDVTKIKNDILKWKNQASQDIAKAAMRDAGLADDPKSTYTFFKDISGTVQGVLNTVDLLGTVYVHWLASNQRGVGTLLMQRVFQEAIKRNVPVQLLSTRPARGFYQKLGMVEDSKDTFRIDVDKMREVMGMKLIEAVKKIDWTAIVNSEPKDGAFAIKPKQVKESVMIVLDESFPGHEGRLGEE